MGWNIPWNGPYLPGTTAQFHQKTTYPSLEGQSFEENGVKLALCLI